jgi:hypothetical protein
LAVKTLARLHIAHLPNALSADRARVLRSTPLAYTVKAVRVAAAINIGMFPRRDVVFAYSTFRGLTAERCGGHLTARPSALARWQRHCIWRRSGQLPGPETPFLAVKHPVYPHKSAIQNRFTVRNAKDALPPRDEGPTVNSRASLGMMHTISCAFKTPASFKVAASLISLPPCINRNVAADAGSMLHCSATFSFSTSAVPAQQKMSNSPRPVNGHAGRFR